MKTPVKLAALALATATAAAATGALTSDPAYAVNHYAIVCLKNDTRANITFQWREGNGGWRSYFLGAGQQMKWTYRYSQANQNHSPYLVVRYDADARSTNFTQSTHLTRRAAVGDSCREGKNYAFRYEANNGNFLQIVYLD